MGYDAVAKIGFGIEIGRGEDMGAPWEDCDICDWWVTERGFTTYAEFVSNPENTGKNYYAEKRKFLEENPCPVEYCSTGYEGEYLLIAVPGTIQSSNDWTSAELDPAKMVISENEVQEFLYFFRKYGVELPEKPTWRICVYYG